MDQEGSKKKHAEQIEGRIQTQGKKDLTFRFIQWEYGVNEVGTTMPKQDLNGL